MDYIKYAAKAAVAVAIPILFEALVQIVDALQNSFADNPIATAVLTALGVFLVRNGPKPS